MENSQPIGQRRACLIIEHRYPSLAISLSFSKFSPKGIFLLILEREREEEKAIEKESERNINLLPPVCALTGDKTCNLGVCPQWESNPQPFGVQDNAPTD